MVLRNQDVKRLRDDDDGQCNAGADEKRSRTDSVRIMDSKEIASAVALASLASFSPTAVKLPVKTPLQTGPGEREEVKATIQALETSCPQPDPIPISPDVPSPIRSIRRVHFASNVEAFRHPEHVDFPQSENAAAHSLPVPLHRNNFGILPSVPCPQAPHWMSRAPPQQSIQPTFGQNKLHWICDFCHSAAFRTYEEACLHEEMCDRQAVTSQPSGVGSTLSSGATRARREAGLTTLDSPVSRSAWFSGSVSLFIAQSDSEWLSEINCFVRKNCVEAFSATEDDVLTTSKRGRITPQQVGIRCCHCKHKPLKERAVAAVSYPTSVAGIYESVKRFHRVHVKHCDCIPEDVKARMTELHNLNVWIPATRQYWTDSARALGMVDTEEGIRFSCDPRQVGEANKSGTLKACSHALGVDPKIRDVKVADRDYIVFPEDRQLVPAYVYFLMRQVESCHFSEVDRFVARSKGPVGYPGFQCRHCSGHAGLGKYFPISAKTLSTNSTSQNIHAHLLKCRKCPDHIKEKLLALKVEKSRTPRLEPGWRKIFFDKVWHRLHR